MIGNADSQRRGHTPLPLPPPGATVAVGLSGGVDSAVTALLLLERGCTVLGVTMAHWKNDGPSGKDLRGKHACFGPDEAEDIEECREFCKKNRIPYHVVDLAAEYEREVLDYFREEYRRGRTPNPCVRCNGRVKFGALLGGLEKAGVTYDYFCTGHYANIVTPDADLPNGAQPVCIARGSDSAKDQSYFLYRVPGDTLQKVRFPLGALHKSEVKAFAAEKNLPQAGRRESQDFAPPETIAALFARKGTGAGDFVDLRGRVLGRHRGIEHYTVGQRKGLGVSGPAPLYVQKIDAGENRIVLAEDGDLRCDSLLAGNWVWAGGTAPAGAFRGTVKIRSGAAEVAAKVAPEKEGTWRVTFDEPVRAAAPGQSAVVYVGDVVFGGGIIEG